MIRNTFLKAVALATVVLALGTGCSSESKTVVGPAGKKLTVKSPSDTSIKPGETASISVDVSRTNFNDPVALTFAGLPDGVTVMEADRTISKDATAAKLTLKATNEAKPVDDHVVTVTGAGGGMTQEVSFKVTVKKSPDVSKKLTLKPPYDTSIKPGETAAISVDITRERFNDPVVLTFAGLPDGVTVMEADRTISKDATTAKLTLKATPEAKLVEGQVVTVTGAGGGATHDGTFKVSVKQK